ncbi:MAG: hypothetical protein Q9221_003899 [Calogaya cf. arnoldii]
MLTGCYAAYHTNRAIFAEDVGRRLENFFWRIWGSHRLDNISGSLVAAIFSKISEGGYIRTTPTQSPRASRTLGTFYRTHQTERTKTSPRSLPSIPSSNGPNLPNDDGAGDAEETETEHTVAGKKKKLPPRPPPILKKPKSISPPEFSELVDQVQRRSAADDATGFSLRESTRPQLQAKSLERSGKTARFNTNEVQSSHSLPVAPEADANVDDETTEPRGKGRSLSNRRKAAVFASTGASRRRPAMRQRSSQVSSSTSSITTPSQMIVEPVTTGPVGFESSFPPRFKQRTVPPSETPVEQKRPAAETTVPSTSLKHRVTHTQSGIEPSGRTMPSNTSFTCLPSIPKKSPAAPASYQATGMMDIGQKTGFSTDLGSSGAATPENPSRLDARASGSNMRPLPRTTSQLTMLLQKDRTSSDHR